MEELVWIIAIKIKIIHYESLLVNYSHFRSKCTINTIFAVLNLISLAYVRHQAIMAIGTLMVTSGNNMSDIHKHKR